MNELVTQLRKDLKLLGNDATFAIFIAVLAAISLFLAFTLSSSYVNSFYSYSSITTEHSIILMQKRALVNYWGQLLNIEAAVMLGAAAMSMSVEKDSGMLRYTLSTKAKKMPFFLSKFIVVTLIALIASVIGLLAYLAAFLVMDMPTIPAGAMLASLAFPMITLIVFATLGLLLASLIRKKGMAVVIAIVVFFLLSLMGTMSMSIGYNEAYKVNSHITALNATDYMPVQYKVLILMNPTVLQYGTIQTVDLSPNDLQYLLGYGYGGFGTPVMYDASGGILLGLAMIAVLFVLGFLLFSRERPTQTMEETPLPPAGAKEV
jgi:ABC-type transport system involved in multi-copper enzyme maturation permease subunit